MTGRFPFTKLEKYPHMKPEDVAVWERFIANNPAFFDTVDYDVPVGTGAPQNPDHPPEIQADGKILTQKKIDVVGYANNRTYIVEVKPIADMRALGQILTYDELYRTDHPDVGVTFPTIVCGEIERELEAMFTKHGVTVEVVPA